MLTRTNPVNPYQTHLPPRVNVFAFACDRVCNTRSLYLASERYCNSAEHLDDRVQVDQGCFWKEKVFIMENSIT